MVTINGKEYVGNDLSINNTGIYIDGIELSKCIEVKYTQMPVGWFQNFFNFFRYWSWWKF